MTGLLSRLDTATAGYYEYFLHSYREGKKLYILHIRHIVSVLHTISLDTDLKGRSPTAALERCLCGASFAKLAVIDTSHSDSK